MSPLGLRFAALPPGGLDPAAGVQVRPGTDEDFRRLSAFHYRAGPPATVAGILTAEHPRHGLVGVLVASRPTLNARWRELAWPGQYRTGHRRDDAARLNAEVRTISRVIVHPRLRALGMAARLVRAYLSSPLTIRTEAVAAMGAVCPFFAAAGMTAWRLPPTRAERRLRAALREARLPPCMLLESARVRAACRAHPGFERALRTWADASRATRRLKPHPVPAIARAAAAALCGPIIAYTHDRAGGRAM
jgi:hypothetical protein